MIEYIEYLNVPTKVALSIVALFLITQVVGELMEVQGKVVPEFVKIRKYFSRKRQEREILRQVPETLREVQQSLNEFKSHYDTDNIRMRDDWIKSVNESLKENDKWIKEFDKKLDKNNADTLSLLIENKRNTVIAFASKVVDDNSSVTREEFNRVFKLYKEYEDIIKDNNLTNGEIDIAYHIIMDAYETHMKNHSFVEDVRGYNI